MAQKKSKIYTLKFKFQLVLEVLQGERSEVEIGRAYGVHHTTISKWKRYFLEHGAEVFGSNEEVERYEKRIAELERLIGQKEVELALLKNFLGGRAECRGEDGAGRRAPRHLWP